MIWGKCWADSATSWMSLKLNRMICEKVKISWNIQFSEQYGRVGNGSRCRQLSSADAAFLESDKIMRSLSGSRGDGGQSCSPPWPAQLHQGYPWTRRAPLDLFTGSKWPLTSLTSMLFVQRNLDHSVLVTGKLQWASQYAVITVDVTLMWTVDIIIRFTWISDDLVTIRS